MRVRRPDLAIPEALDAAVMKCLKKKVHERPKNAQELEDMLAAIPLEGLPTAYPAGTNRRAPSVPPPKKDAAQALKEDAKVNKEATTMSPMESSPPAAPDKS